MSAYEDRPAYPCDPLHAAWARAYLAWDEPEIDRLDDALDASCTHPQHTDETPEAQR